MLREFLQHLRPKVKTTGVLDALLVAETAALNPHRPSTVTEREEALAVPVAQRPWRAIAGVALVSALGAGAFFFNRAGAPVGVAARAEDPPASFDFAREGRGGIAPGGSRGRRAESPARNRRGSADRRGA